MPFPKAIITKPFLVTDADLIDLGQNINLVGYDTFGKSIENTNQYVSPKLINWVEPYEISGIKKTLFYTEVNSNLMVGDKVFIINGAYDSNSLIKKDKYKKGRDGYNVLKVENCKIVLDIDYTGISPYKDDSLDDYIKVYYIENKESFLHANRQVTTRGGKFDYKFNYGQNNVAFVDHNYPEMDNWGFNGGIIGAPGFFVRNRKDVWSNISDDLIYLGSFSVALSETYGSNGKIFIQDGDFVYNGIQFKEGFAYKWEIGPTGSSWTVDVEYSKAIITKANFRNGTFNGKFNNGLYGTQESKIEWSGVGTWNGGTILNSIWKSGTMYSKIDVIKTYKTSLDENGYPFQKSYADNNGGFGFNYIIDSEMESSLVSNGNFQNTKFMQSSGTFSVVENHVLSITQSFGNNIEKAYFDLCEFEDIEIKGGEIRNTRAMNSKFTNVKLVNSYIKKSVVKDSTYIGDGVIKILGYDEWNMSEYMNLASGEYSSIKDVNQKIYKFYISKESYKRFKSEDTFYIKGLKINDGTKKLLNFFDSKFRLTSWTEFYDDYATESKSTTGVDPYSFHKRGYECSAFLSTPEENSYIINSYETEYWYKSPNELTGGTHSKYSTTLAGKNPNAGYSIDIIVARHDIVNKNISMDKNSEWESLNPKNYNYDSDVLPGTSSVPAYLGNMIDISGAYILDADFESGIIETSDWNSGHHINYNNDVVITPVSSDGRYDLEIDSINDLLIANTSKLMDNPERIGVDVLSKGDIVFLNSVDYDTTGMVTKVSVMTTGSSYSTSFDKKLVNTSILSTTMSNYGTNYKTGVDLPTISSGSGTGVTVDIVANPIGAVLGITYSTPIISKTGLKLSMDPEFSYPGSGTSWTDLTNSYSGSLVGGVVYDSVNKAFSTLTSTSTTPRWISLNSWIQFGDGNEYSMEFSVKLRTGAEGTFHSLCGNGGFDGWIGIEGTANSWRLFFRDGVAGSNLYTYSPLITNFDLSNSWAVIGITVDSMRNIKFYLNGAFVCITAPTLISAMINISRIGGGYDDSGRYYPFQGLISTTRIYNRPLAASEMFVNYNLTIDRLGSGAPIYVPANGGPIATSFSTDTSILPPSYVTTIVTDTDGSATGVVNATYSVFGPPQNPMSSVAQGAGVIFTAGPHFTGGGMTVDYAKTANGLITNIYISDYGVGYLPGQIFKVEGGNATFSISSVSKGEIISYSIKSKGEDYINGDVLEIAKSFDPNSLYNNGITASIIVISITASSFDEKGLTLDIITGSGSYDGKITDITIKTPGLYYKEGEIFTINDGNLDAIVKIESVTGSVTRLGDTYKVVENNSGVVSLQEVATQSSISGMVSGGIFYTAGAENRWGYISKSKFDRTKIKSGLLRRAYITKSLINDINYDSSDKDFLNYERTKNLLITDSLFSNNSNILSSATYLYSNIVGGSDIWNDGIIFKSALNGMTFSKGVVRQSIWMDGDFTGGLFYDSRSFDAKPTDIKPNYLSNRARSYFFTGALGSGIFNSRYSWQKGRFSGGEFYKSDWESGIFDNGLFYYSKFYSGTFNNGVVGTKDVSTGDTKIYNGIINYAIVDNAYVYSEDPSYTGMSSSSIEWMDGVFNNGIFGSNNQDVIGTTVSNISYPGLFSALPIKDFKVATYTQSVTNNDIILNDLEITGKINLKHTYIGDLIINLMAPNGMIVNLKKRYSGGSSDNLIETNFTSDLTKPSLEISTSPHTGDFAFANVLNHGVYYKMDGTLLSNVDYQENLRSIPQVLDYASFPPNQTYEGDRYLVIATSSDPKWTANSPTTWIAYADMIVEKKYNGTWLPSTGANRNGDYLYIKNRNEYLKYITKSVVSFSNRRSTATSVNTWVKSYHSNTTNPSALMNADKTITGIWTLLVMDVAGADVGFVDDFTLNFNYKNNFIIKSFKNDAVWKNGIFNGGQFVDLGVWKNGKFNGGKFISTYGHSKSGNYLIFNKNQDDYSWQAGQFNGGEFGNESSLTNSTWFNGEFNGGVFKGKIWNNGVFLYGEFKGGSSVPVLGSDSKGTSASAFVEQFRNGYYGVWRNGVVSDKKDSFITDQKLFTTPVRSVSPVISNKKAVFTNMLWLGGIFNHPSGVMKNSAWLDGLFQMGRFESSSFNPYVKRYSDNLEFLKDDSCIWENGKLVGSEFFFSKWNYGHFISGTASGMIWKDGIADYMNAYNIFWEKGVWRNGNWNGSSFEYSGEILDGFVKEILNRGIEWSGTNSCHIWNIFETDVDKTNNMVVSNISDTFATDSQEDAGNGTPKLGATPSYSMHATQPNSVVITYHILSDSGARITQTGIVYSETDPGINLSGGQITLVSGSSKVVYATSLTTKTISASTYPKGMTVSNILVYGLTPGTVYKGLGYAINSEGKAYTTGLLEFEYVVKNVVSYLSPTTDQSGELAAINVAGQYSTTNSGYSKPLTKGILYSSTNANPDFTDATVIKLLDTTDNGRDINVTIERADLLPATDYFIRAYAHNKAGYGYSAVQKITTGVIDPLVSMNAPTLDTLSGSVTYTGGSTSLKRGFIIWQADQPLLMPIITNHPDSYVPANSSSTANYYRINAVDGDIGTFSQLIDGLTPNTYYKAKAFAYNPAVNGIFAWDLTPIASIPDFLSPAAEPTIGDVSVSIAPMARMMMLKTGEKYVYWNSHATGNKWSYEPATITSGGQTNVLTESDYGGSGNSLFWNGYKRVLKRSGNFEMTDDTRSYVWDWLGADTDSFFSQNRDNPLLMQLELSADMTSIGGTPITETGIVYTDGSYWDSAPYTFQGNPAGYQRRFIRGTASSAALQFSQNEFHYFNYERTFGTYPGTTVPRPMVPWAPFATPVSNFLGWGINGGIQGLSLAYSNKPYVWNSTGNVGMDLIIAPGDTIQSVLGGFINFDPPFFDLNNKTVYLNTTSDGNQYLGESDDGNYLIGNIAYAGRMIISEQKNSWAYRWKPNSSVNTWDWENIGNDGYLYTAQTPGGVVIGTAGYTSLQLRYSYGIWEPGVISPVPLRSLNPRVESTFLGGSSRILGVSHDGGQAFWYNNNGQGNSFQYSHGTERRMAQLENETAPLPQPPTGAGKITYNFKRWYPFASDIGIDDYSSVSIKPGLYVEPSQANKLLPGKVYYAKAYAKNKIGIGISKNVTKFTTLPLIVDPVLSFGTQSFTASFTIYSYGATISSFGMIWTDVEDPSTLSWWPTYNGTAPTLPPSTNSTTETFAYYDYTFPQPIDKFSGGYRYEGKGGYISWSGEKITQAFRYRKHYSWNNSYGNGKIALSKKAGKELGHTPLPGNTSLKVLVYAKNEGGVAYGIPAIVDIPLPTSDPSSSDQNYFQLGTVSVAPNFTLVDVTLPGDGSSTGEISHPGVFGNGTQSIIEKGIYYSTTDPLVVSGTKVVCTSTGATDMNAITYTSTTAPIVSARGGFTVTIPALTPGKKYYFKTYWKNSTGTAYGPIGSLESGPTVSGNISVNVNANFSDEIVATDISIVNTSKIIIERGLVWKASYADEYGTQIPITTDPGDFSTNSSWLDGSNGLWTQMPDISHTLGSMTGNYFVYARLYVKYKDGGITRWSYSSEQKISSVARAKNFAPIAAWRSDYSYLTAIAGQFSLDAGACADTATLKYSTWGSGTTDIQIKMANGLSVQVGDTVWAKNSYNNWVLFTGSYNPVYPQGGYNPPPRWWKIALNPNGTHYEPLNLSCGTKATTVSISSVGVITAITCCP